jgi:hypothetical protein
MPTEKGVLTLRGNVFVAYTCEEHSLNVDPKAKLVKQKLRRFEKDKKEAIRVEVTRLLAAGFIK